ncbi:MAG: hypothetical protein IPH80_09630 [Myxococcales bacterium]|nr:hypothetical protein [Myxococcales bacterium]
MKKKALVAVTALLLSHDAMALQVAMTPAAQLWPPCVGVRTEIELDHTDVETLRGLHSLGDIIDWLAAPAMIAAPMVAVAAALIMAVKAGIEGADRGNGTRVIFQDGVCQTLITFPWHTTEYQSR